MAKEREPKTVTPQPMPTTGYPDRLGYNPPLGFGNMKAGLMSSNGMNINPGKPASDKDDQ